MGKNNLINIKIGDNYFSFDLKYVRRLIEAENISPIPFVEKYIKGVLNFEGEIWVIISLENLMYGKEEEKKLILLLNKENYFIGILCDEVMEIMDETSIKSKNKPDREKIKLPLDSISEILIINDQPVYKVDFEKFIEEMSRF